MNKDNIKYYAQMVLYYVLTATRAVLIGVFAPIAWCSGAITEAVTDWTVSKPLAKHVPDDIDYDKHLGI